MLIELDGVSKTYRIGSGDVSALLDVSLTVARGEFVALIGPSGSGKSTLLHILGFLDQPDRGRYHFAGSYTEKLSDPELSTLRNRFVGFVFQSYHLLASASALSNVTLPMLYSSHPSRPGRAQEALKAVGLGDRLLHHPNQLSGGQQQRVAIARALANEPALLLADEPTGNLDSKSREEILSLIETLHARGLTVILVTHDPEVAARAWRVIQLKDGRIVSDESRKKAAHAGVATEQATLELPTGRRGFGLEEIAEQARVALTSIFSHRLRSVLTILGILMGIASIITILTLGEGTKSVMLGSMGNKGARLLMVTSGASSSAGVQRLRTGVLKKLNMEDARDILAVCPSVFAVAPKVMGNAFMQRRNRSAHIEISGVSADYPQAWNIEGIQGRFFTQREDLYRARVAVLTKGAVKTLFEEGEEPLEQDILVARIPFRVIGILTKGAGSPLAGGVSSKAVLVPLQTAMKRVLGSSDLDMIEVQAAGPETVASAKTEVEKFLRKRHRIQEGQGDDFTVQSFEQMMSEFKKVLGILTLFLASIAGISLLVGGIGIMNIMLVSVTERTREIGLRRAIGARRSDILLQFLVESVILCLVGGAGGIALGWLGSWGLGKFIDIHPTLTLAVVALACVFSSVVGIIFGFWPALKASRLIPIEALRYE